MVTATAVVCVPPGYPASVTVLAIARTTAPAESVILVTTTTRLEARHVNPVRRAIIQSKSFVQ